MLACAAMGRGAAHYVTSLDRAGLALGAGGALSGVVALLLVLAGGQRDPLSLGLAWLLGAVFAMFGIVAVAGPVWLALHLAGQRGPGTAAATAALVALAILVASQTFGFGAWTPAGAAATLPWRFASALASGAVAAILAAAIGWTMQRIAYRRLF